MTPAGGAAARDVRRRRALARASATRCCSREWFCVGRLDDLGLDEPERVAVVDVLGESVLVDPRRRRRAARGVQRLPPPRLPARAGRPGRAAPAAVRGEVAALPLPLLDLRPRRSAAAGRRTPRTSTTSTRRSSRCTRSASSTWGGFVFVHLTPGARAAARRRARPGAGATLGRYPLDALVDRADAAPTTSRPTGRCSPRTTTSATTAGRCTPSCRGWCRRSAAAARTSTGTTASRTARAPGRSPRPAPPTGAPFPGLDDAERVRHKGELVYPNLMLSLSADHVAAFVLRPLAVDRTEIVCDLLFAPDEVAAADVRPVRRRRPLGPGQPAGLGDLRVGAARHVVARLHAGLVRADGGRSLDIRRWLLPRLERGRA